MDFCSPVATAKLLLQPRGWWKCTGVATEYSHWINLKTIPDEFVQRGHEKLITQQPESRFDVILADAVGPCVYSLRSSPGYTIDKYSGGLPFPPSFVLVVMSELSDQMTFLEGYKILHRRPTALPELMGKAETWFIRTYRDFEFFAHSYHILNVLENSTANLPNPCLT
ncbi:hypothetical protein HPG69_002619 [Diceros bicornis minor]|uniref:Uncharacterized protein n=1 Tax=Diceros bicornis minor TaxID=77932 RepID=A0A7J7EMD1_DICBM|nr:hypothetical protein HPG69_002619 [Diceros bicornis minor]